MKSGRTGISAHFVRSHRSEILSYGAGKGLKISELVYTLRLEQNKKLCEVLKLVQSAKNPSKNE